jgi:cobalt-precorrin 5A hydrolase / precorrin-3B C17-methyltransferase
MDESPQPPEPAAPPPVYPIFLTQLHEVQAVVVGGGQVGQRKVAGLLAANAQVTLVSPEITSHLQAWHSGMKIRWHARPYCASDLEGAGLVFAATNNRTVNAQVAQDAAARGLLCNVADAPHEGNFHVPALVRKQNITVAVGTGGIDPTRAKQLRDQIAHWLDALEG